MKLQSMDQNNSNVECKKLLSYIMSIGGDCRLMLSHVLSAEEIDKLREQYQTTTEIDLEIQNVIDEVGIDENSSGKYSYFSYLNKNICLHIEFSWVFELTPIIERNLFASAQAYEYAINIVRYLGDSEKSRLQLLIKRLGNVRNEMGVYWMNRYAQALKQSDQDGNRVRRTNKDQHEFFSSGFERLLSEEFGKFRCGYSSL